MVQVFLEMTHVSRACNLEGMDLKKRIEELLAAKKANMSDLATFCGVTPQAVQQWVSMGRMPRPERLMRIAEFFGITESELFNNSPAKNATESGSVDFPTPTAIRGQVPTASSAEIKLTSEQMAFLALMQDLTPHDIAEFTQQIHARQVKNRAIFEAMGGRSAPRIPVETKDFSGKPSPNKKEKAE